MSVPVSSFDKSARARERERERARFPSHPYLRVNDGV